MQCSLIVFLVMVKKLVLSTFSCSLKSNTSYVEFESSMYWPLAYFCKFWTRRNTSSQRKVGVQNKNKAATAKYLNCVIASLFLT